MRRIDRNSLSRWLARVFGFLALGGCVLAAGSSRADFPPFAPNDSPGRLIVLPGIHNTLFQLDGFVEAAQLGLPNFVIERRRWGVPLMGIRNLRAAEDNLAFAQRVAADIARWRRDNPGDLLYLMGYSGGGGVASLVLRELSAGVAIDRLILVAPAISTTFDVERLAAEHVREFVVNYASAKDLQVGLGTRWFGTIDRRYEYAAGYDGFDDGFEKLVEWHWRASDRAFGHTGNHVAYLGRRWQRGFLLPAVDPDLTAKGLASAWEERRESVAGR